MDFKNVMDTIITSSVIVISVSVALIAILTYLRKGRFKAGRFQVDFEKRLGAVAEVGETKMASFRSKPPEQKQYLLLKEYHAQGLSQSKISFWFSLIFASLGFFVIIIAILTMDRTVKFTEQGTTFITLTAGTIIDAVSALFFVQSNKARKLMTEFFDKLRADRKFEKSLLLADQIPNEDLQSRLKIMLSLNFADVKSTDGILSSMFNMEQQPNKRNEMKKEKSGKAKEGKPEKKQSE